MEILLKVLKELNFDFREKFNVYCNLSDDRKMTVSVNLLISNKNNTQTFLVINCDNSQLADYVDGEIIKQIASKFRKRECHRADMDKNTSLLLVCKYQDDMVDTSSKIIIEDDPYYFKKYVFSYNEKELESAACWLKQNEGKGSIISLVQDYITDTSNISKYKENYLNEPIYAFFIELVTKLHCFPMKAAESKNIKTVNDYLKKELDDLRNKPRRPVDIDSKRVESFIELKMDITSVDDVCQKWNLLLEEGSES